MFQMTISQRCLDNGLAPTGRQAIIGTKFAFMRHTALMS